MPQLAVVEGPPAFGIASVESSINAKVYHRQGRAPGCDLRMFEKVAPASITGSGLLLDTDALTERLRIKNCKRSWFLCIAWRPDGQQFALSSDDGSVRILNASTGAEVLRIQTQGRVSCVAWRPDSLKLAVGGADMDVNIFNMLTGTQDARLTHRDAVRSLSWHEDCCRLATGSNDKVARIFDTTCSSRIVSGSGFRACQRPGECSEAMLVHPDCVWSVAWGPIGYKLATACADGSVRIWDTIAGKQLLQVKHSCAVRSVAWRPDGCKLASACHDGVARIVDVETGNVETLAKHSDHVTCVAWHPKTWDIATGCLDRCVRLFDSAGTEMYRTRHTSQIPCIAWRPRIDDVLDSLQRTTMMSQEELANLLAEAKAMGVDSEIVSKAETKLRAIQQRAAELLKMLESSGGLTEEELDALVAEAKSVGIDLVLIEQAEARLRPKAQRVAELFVTLRSNRLMSDSELEDLLAEARTLGIDSCLISELEKQLRGIQEKAHDLLALLRSGRFMAEDELDSLVAEALALGIDPNLIAREEAQLREVNRRGNELLARLQSNDLMSEDALAELLAAASLLGIDPQFLLESKLRLQALQQRAAQLQELLGSDSWISEEEFHALVDEARALGIDPDIIDRAEARLRDKARRIDYVLSVMHSNNLLRDSELSDVLKEAQLLGIDPELISEAESRHRRIQKRAAYLMAKLGSNMLMSETDLAALLQEAARMGIDAGMLSELEARLRAIQVRASELMTLLQTQEVMTEEALVQLVSDAMAIGIDPDIIAIEEARLRAIIESEEARLQGLAEAREVANLAQEAADAAQASSMLRRHYMSSILQGETRKAIAAFSKQGQLLEAKAKQLHNPDDELDHVENGSLVMPEFPETLKLSFQTLDSYDERLKALESAWRSMSNIFRLLKSPEPENDDEFNEFEKRLHTEACAFNLQGEGCDSWQASNLKVAIERASTSCQSLRSYFLMLQEKKKEERREAELVAKLLHAVCSGNAKEIERLLSSVEDPVKILQKAADLHGDPLLHAAVVHAKSEAISVLVHYGAEISIEDVNGSTPLDVAIERFHAAEIAANASGNDVALVVGGEPNAQELQACIDVLCSLGAESRRFLFYKKRSRWVKRPEKIETWMKWKALFIDEMGSIEKAFKSIDSNGSGGIVLYEMRSFSEDANINVQIHSRGLDSDQFFHDFDELGGKKKEQCVKKASFMLLDELDDNCTSEKWQEILLE